MLAPFFNIKSRMTRWLAGTTAAFTLASTLGFFGPSPAAAQEAITVGQCYSFPQMERLLRAHGQQEFMEGYRYTKQGGPDFIRTDFTFSPRTATGYQIRYSVPEFNPKITERCVEREITEMQVFPGHPADPLPESALLNVGSRQLAIEAAKKAGGEGWGHHDEVMKTSQAKGIPLQFLGKALVPQGERLVPLFVTFAMDPVDHNRGMGPLGTLGATVLRGPYAGTYQAATHFFRTKRVGTGFPRVSLAGETEPPQLAQK